MKNYLMMLAVSTALAGCASMAQNNSEATTPGNEKEVSYAIGVSIGENLKAQGMNDLNYDEIAKGMKEANEGTATIDNGQAQKLIQDYQMAAKSAMYAENLKKSEDFLAENGKKDGVITTESGLQYKVIKEGTGATPTKTDKVTVHYDGTLTDGTPFDSSRKKGSPATFGVSQVISGWTEGLQLMNEGAVFEFYIHPDLGYGLNPRPGVIQPNDALVFNVELIKVN